MTEPIDFSQRKSRRDLQASKAAALASIDATIAMLQRSRQQVVEGLVDWEYDDLLLEITDTLDPVRQFLDDELKPENIEPI